MKPVKQHPWFITVGPLVNQDYSAINKITRRIRFHNITVDVLTFVLSTVSDCLTCEFHKWVVLFLLNLKQHNGELKGGAKASRAGRPWICACIIRGFNDRSEACKFESKWKSFSRKLPRKRIDDDQMKQSSKDSHQLLLHRKTALNRVKGSFDLSHLEIDWKLNAF
ncbi:hypothetical protein POTOM_059926 [Populus tomentosa]|uniref:Uncharacterized protein n=1 Tax=Populus tomentosa TaxID=118781 RepID=A0A8X7Y0U1_POPTO|nr:hypothetical protein POTOM_059926 [Populus tomentosa]